MTRTSLDLMYELLVTIRRCSALLANAHNELNESEQIYLKSQIDDIDNNLKEAAHFLSAIILESIYVEPEDND